MLTAITNSRRLTQSMDAAWGRTGGSPSPQVLRLASSTADYAVVLLRTLEMLAGAPRCCAGASSPGELGG